MRIQWAAPFSFQRRFYLTLAGRTFCLYGESGSGKSTQIGELAKYVYKKTKKKTILNTSDRGGFDSLGALVRKGIVVANELGETDDPWIYIDDAASGRSLTDEIGCVAFDSGTSLGESLLSACSHAEFQIGQQRTQKFAVSKGSRSLNVSINNEAHYGVVQGFLLDAIWKSTWLTRRGIDVIWTFGVHRGEEQDRTPIIGPKLAGKALTASIPRWFRYTFRLDLITQENESPIHRLYLSAQPELAGLGKAFGNARYPLGVTPLPPYVEPASLPVALDLIEKGQAEADAQLEAEFAEEF